MKHVIFFIALILATEIIFAQKASINEYGAIDKLSLQLPDSLTRTTDEIASYITSNFKTDKEKVRAIFIWIVPTFNTTLKICLQ